MKEKNVEYLTKVVFENIKISSGTFKLVVKGNFKGKSGQFYMIRGWNKEPLLSRPISIHHIDDEKIVFLYQVIGQGTEALSELEIGDKIELLGPLGNGFDVDNIKGKVAMVTGGIGIAPMFYVAEGLSDCETDLYCGFRSDIYGIDNFKKYVNDINIATESGEVGHKGYVTEIFQPELYDVVLCCGPEPMMEKVVLMCREKNVPVYVSMEKHMACGIGACLVCTCKTKHGNKRTCKDGPVFLGDDIVI